MKTLKTNSPAIFIILSAILIRLFPHAPNFAPIGAMALFSGVYLPKKYSLFILLVIMLLSDYLLLYVNPYAPQWINFSKLYSPLALLHGSTIPVYAGFLAYYLIGLLIAKRKTIVTVAAGTLTASVLFFIITNFGFWLAFDLYPKTWSGQMEAYIAALPFFRNTLLSDLFYSGVFFGVYEIIILNVKTQMSKLHLKSKNFEL